MNTLYTVADHTLWTGRPDALPNEYLYQIIKPLNLNTPEQGLNGYGLIGFASDEGIKRNKGKPGAAEGPMAFRQAAGRLAVHKRLSIYDAGNVICPKTDLELAQQTLGRAVSGLFRRGLTPVVIGGGHETAWGHFQGIHEFFPKKDIAILNFDAHFDLRPLLPNDHGSSGTPFRQINELLRGAKLPFSYYCVGIQPFSNSPSLFDYATQHQVKYQLAEALHHHPMDFTFIDQIISQHEAIYVSICLDVLAAAYAPGVSAPQVLGISPLYVVESIKRLKQSGKVISFDIVELAPCFDNNHQTAKLAAHFFMEFVAG